MIESLTGVIRPVSAESVLVNVGGVAFQCLCSRRTQGFFAPDSEARLLIVLRFREDQFYLYGFADQAEREAFLLLQRVQGVGARLALAILSLLAPDELALAIASEDPQPLKRVSGVGPKLALRIVRELKSGLEALSYGGQTVSAGAPANAALEALLNLGYGRAEALAALAGLESLSPEEASRTEDEALALQIKAALQKLAAARP